MADLARSHPMNADGDWFVDQTCIDCDTCQRMAPAIYDRDPRSGNAFVRSQPTDPEARKRAAMALLSCPVGAIGTRGPADLSPALRALPEEIAPGVYQTGFASEDSYGASAWLVRRPEGNVLVDSPRAAGPLLRNLDALGGVGTMFLTHVDDVADHAAFHARYGCSRILHRRDARFPVERPIDGDDPVRLADDLLAIPVPGHTRGSTALLVADRYLFTGDHLWGEDGALHASRSVCWWSWEAQLESLERLLDFSFEWVLPGHGAPLHAPPARMRALLEEAIARMR